MNIKKLFLYVLRYKIGFVNICPYCYTFKTELIGITGNGAEVIYRRQCKKCFLSYDIVS